MEYGCIGEHLPHSFSKEIHEQIGSYQYELHELTLDQLETFMQKKDFKAINVTIPYKQAVIPYLHKTDTIAAEVGAVNTVVNKNGRLYGYNTDVYGMEALLLKNGICLTGKKVLVLGSGGTAKTANAVAKRAHAGSVYTVSRNKRECCITYEEAYAQHADADVIINTTPVGMYPDIFKSPIDLKPFYKLQAAADAVYNPLKTVFIRDAENAGATGCNGLYMLVAQAIKAYSVFMDKEFEPELCDAIYTKTLTDKQNIVLIGMPGAGKTTVGKLLAQLLGRPFYDTDEIIKEKVGMDIPEIFSLRGEASFREMETGCIKELSANNACVIATGGGAVLRQENIDALKMNGRIYFLDRPPGRIVPTADRPLTLTKEAIIQRYKERYPLYRAAADETVLCDGLPEDAAYETERRHRYESFNH